MRRVTGVTVMIFTVSVLQAAITRGPVLQPTADLETSVGIMWSCENSSTGTVTWGITSASENSASTPSGTDHEITITGLQAGTTYKYQVSCDGATTPVYEFRTSSSSGERRVIVISDMHAQPGSTWEPQQANWIPEMTAFGPDLIVLPGDLVSTGDDLTHYDAMFSHYRELFATAIVAPAPGNHEWAYDTTLAIYTDTWYLPRNCPGAEEKNYYFDYGGVRWVMVSNSSFSGNETWVQNALSSASGADFKCAVSHYPVYLSCEYDDEMVVDISGWKVDFRSALETSSADMHFSGHRHLYHRSTPLLSTEPSPAVSPSIGSGWGGPTTIETANYTDPAGIIYLELSALWYQKTGAIYQRDPFFAAVGPVNGDEGKEWLGYTTLVTAGSLCTVDTYVFSRDGAVKERNVDHFVLDKSGGSSISGMITDGGTGIEGVRVEIDASHFSFTNASGQYTIAGLADGTYTATPSKLGYSFTPASRSVTVTGSDVTGIDFTGAASGGTVIFQKGLDGYLGVEDTMLRSSSADTNYGDHEEIRTVMSGGSVDRMSLIRFDVSAIPSGAVIDSATLEIYLFNKAGDGNFHIGTMNVDWGEMEATWNERLGGTAWSGADARSSASEFATVGQGSSDSWVTFVVTDVVQDWVESTPNYGFLVWPDGTVDDRFCSSDYVADAALRPKLTVTYTASGPDETPPTVTLDSVAMDGTVSDDTSCPTIVSINGTDVTVNVSGSSGTWSSGDLSLAATTTFSITAEDAGQNGASMTVDVNIP